MKTQLRPLSEASTSVVYGSSGSPRIVTCAPRTSPRCAMPMEFGARVYVGSQAPWDNDKSGGEKNIESKPKPGPPLPPPTPPPPSPMLPSKIVPPTPAPSCHHRSSSASSVSARSFREVKRKVSRIWWRVSKLEKDKERRKMGKEWERRRWEDQVDQRLSDRRWGDRDRVTRGRVRYIYPHER